MPSPAPTPVAQAVVSASRTAASAVSSATPGWFSWLLNGGIGQWLSGDDEKQAKINADAQAAIAYINGELKAGHITENDWQSRYKQINDFATGRINNLNIARAPIGTWVEQRVKEPTIDWAIDLPARQRIIQDAANVAEQARQQYLKSGKTPADLRNLNQATNNAFRAASEALPNQGPAAPAIKLAESLGGARDWLAENFAVIKWIGLALLGLMLLRTARHLISTK